MFLNYTYQHGTHSGQLVIFANPARGGEIKNRYK